MTRKTFLYVAFGALVVASAIISGCEAELHVDQTPAVVTHQTTQETGLALLEAKPMRPGWVEAAVYDDKENMVYCYVFTNGANGVAAQCLPYATTKGATLHEGGRYFK